MPTYTTYKKLEKPLSVEKYDIGVANKNNDVVDSELHKLDLKNESQDESLSQEISRATSAENKLSVKIDNMISDFTEKIDELNYLISESKYELFEIVDVLPTFNISPIKIYLLLNDNKYLKYVYVDGEYIDDEYINGKWKNIGTIQINDVYETDNINFTQLFDETQN